MAIYTKGAIDKPSVQESIIYDEPGTLSTRVVEHSVPEPGSGEVLIRLTHSGVCHSDLGVMMSSWSTLPAPTPKGQVGGHEGVGHIVKLGPGADVDGVKNGDRVGVKWVSSICSICRSSLFPSNYFVCRCVSNQLAKAGEKLSRENRRSS